MNFEVYREPEAQKIARRFRPRNGRIAMLWLSRHLATQLKTNSVFAVPYEHFKSHEIRLKMYQYILVIKVK